MITSFRVVQCRAEEGRAAAQFPMLCRLGASTAHIRYRIRDSYHRTRVRAWLERTCSHKVHLESMYPEQHRQLPQTELTASLAAALRDPTKLKQS